MKNDFSTMINISDRKRRDFRHAPQIVKAILEAGEHDDLVILGSAQDPRIRQMTRDSVSTTCIREYDKPMVIAKASGGLGSWIKRWL